VCERVFSGPGFPSTHLPIEKLPTPEMQAELQAERIEKSHCGPSAAYIGLETDTWDNILLVRKTEEQRIHDQVKKGHIWSPDKTAPISVKQLSDQAPKYTGEDGPYQQGDWVKISGDKADVFREYHNQAAKILAIYDPYHFKVKTENGSILGIRDTDVKKRLTEDDLQW